MNLGQSIIEALGSLNANKLRSGLTILGIVIGVAAVIAMLAIGRGAQNSITSSINGIGTNLLYILPCGSSSEVRNVKPLTIADATAMQDQLAAPAVAAVAPVIQTRQTVSFNGKDTSTSIMGVTPDYAVVSNELMDQGDFITEDNILSRSAVAVIGPTTAQNLFGTTFGVVDQTIRIANQPGHVFGDAFLSQLGGLFGNHSPFLRPAFFVIVLDLCRGLQAFVHLGASARRHHQRSHKIKLKSPYIHFAKIEFHFHPPAILF